MPGVAQRTVVALVIGGVLLGAVVAAVVTSILDADNTSSSSSVTTTSRAKPVPLPTLVPQTTPPTAAVSAPCTATAILQAIQQGGINATSVAGVQCGNGWAGASYETAQIAGASLLKAQDGHWVVTDRGQSCNDPTIPPAVHFYCTVS